MGSPTWHSGIALNTWGTLPNSNLNSSGVYTPGSDDPTGFDAWSGAILVTGGLYIGSTFTAGTFLVRFGGGHGNYSGNEVYAYGPLENNSPTWNRLRDRTSPAPDDVETDGSGNPVSRHSYDSMVYVNDGTRNAMYVMGAKAAYHSSNSYSHVLKYDFNQVSPNSNQPWSLKATIHGPAPTTIYDLSSGRVFYRPDALNQIGYYDVAGDADHWSAYKSPPFNANAASCIDTVRGLWCLWDSANGITFYRTNNGTGNDWYTPTTTGSGPTLGDGSIIYDAGSDALKIWVGGGKTIWTLTPPVSSPYAGGNAWTWSSATPGSGSTPSAQASTATFGRFAYSPNVNVPGYLLVNAYNGSIYFYKSAASIITAPSGFKALLGVGV